MQEQVWGNQYLHPSLGRDREKDQSRISVSFPLVVMLVFNKCNYIINLSLFAVVIHKGGNITCSYYSILSTHELGVCIYN
jgi:hypothetical protein